MPIELPVVSERLKSPFVVDIWIAAVSGRVDRLVLDPTQVAAPDWALLLWLSRAYHLPVELMVKDSSPSVAAGVIDEAGSCLMWGANWWEVEHHGAMLPISPRISWVLRALSTGAPDAPMQLDDLNRRLVFWNQPPVPPKNFRGMIRAARFRVPGHIVTSRRRGYVWQSCQAQNQLGTLSP